MFRVLNDNDYYLLLVFCTSSYILKISIHTLRANGSKITVCMYLYHLCFADIMGKTAPIAYFALLVHLVKKTRNCKFNSKINEFIRNWDQLVIKRT